ncbi:MAG: phenylalanine--tRNA ligase subunit alpha, partial [Candidatus Aenigmarchaeota archaeon]|nr:phenylalanine--tRNA ligase subunit alpha [Candidatus Aenigmarchaeota archaeon]
MYELTEEGNKYLEEGLPELNLLKEAEKNKDIKKLKENVENFNIALQWAKKNGWIRIDKGEIIVEKKSSKYDLQESLKNHG